MKSSAERKENIGVKFLIKTVQQSGSLVRSSRIEWIPALMYVILWGSRFPDRCKSLSRCMCVCVCVFAWPNVFLCNRFTADSGAAVNTEFATRESAEKDATKTLISDTEQVINTFLIQWSVARLDGCKL